MPHSRIVRYVVIGALLVAALIVPSAFAQDTEPVVIAATADGITLPEGLTAGYTVITFNNETEAPFAPVLARLNDGATVEQFMGALAQGPQAALALVGVLGNPDVHPGESRQVGYDLLAGDYLFIQIGPGGPPNILPFSVAEAEGEPTPVPEADVTMQMVDFAFAIPGEIAAGEQVWQISNLGEQVHHMFVYKVEDDAELPATLEAFIAAYRAIVPGQPFEFPYENVYTWEVMSPGETAYPVIDLRAGRYAIVCFIGDSASPSDAMISHLEHGMLRLVSVTEAS
jgi:hypothetical protein